jgi:hypothetical protein
MTVSDAHKLKELEAENLRLKKIVATQLMEALGCYPRLGYWV